MSVTQNSIVLYQSSSMVSGDGIAIGGSVNFSGRVGFSDVSPNQAMAWVSSSASDTTGVTGMLAGRDPTGIIYTTSTTLDGQTPASGTQTFQRLLSGLISGASFSGDIAAISVSAIVTGTAQSASNTSGVTAPYIQLQAGQVSGNSLSVENIVRITNNTPSGVEYQLRRITGTSGSTDLVFVNEDWTTVPSSSTTYAVYNGMLFERSPNSVTNLIRIFFNCVADIPGGSNRNYYSKCFAVNNSSDTTLTSVGYQITSTDPTLPIGATLQFGLASGLNDSETATNRQTAPTSITFTTGSPPVSSGQYASGGNLPPNSAGALGFWFNLALIPGAAPFDGYASIQASGQTT